MRHKYLPEAVVSRESPTKSINLITQTMAQPTYKNTVECVERGFVKPKGGLQCTSADHSDQLKGSWEFQVQLPTWNTPIPRRAPPSLKQEIAPPIIHKYAHSKVCVPGLHLSLGILTDFGCRWKMRALSLT